MSDPMDRFKAAADALADRAASVFDSNYYNTCPIEAALPYYKANRATLTEYRAARAAIEAQTAHELWQPIDTCPSAPVIFHGNTRHDARVVFTGWMGQNGRFYADNGDSVKPTHWMPLPLAPKDQPHD